MTIQEELLAACKAALNCPALNCPALNMEDLEEADFDAIGLLAAAITRGETAKAVVDADPYPHWYERNHTGLVTGDVMRIDQRPNGSTLVQHYGDNGKAQGRPHDYPESWASTHRRITTVEAEAILRRQQGLDIFGDPA